MGVALAKQAIDLGIVTGNGEAALGFYRDLLGFRHEADTPFPGGGTMHRLWCGDSLIKIVVPADAPVAKPPAGAIPAAQGYRYWTMTVTNLAEVMADLKAAGVKVVIDETEIRAGVTIAIVEDPDGNLVEFVKTG